jgi:hypothetical protein
MTSSALGPAIFHLLHPLREAELQWNGGSAGLPRGRLSRIAEHVTDGEIIYAKKIYVKSLRAKLTIVSHYCVNTCEGKGALIVLVRVTIPQCSISRVLYRGFEKLLQ